MAVSFALGDRSRSRLVGVSPDLVRVVELAITLTTQDFAVLEGLRTLERQRELWAQGRTAPGKIVTWTMDSPHLKGLAVDLAPWPIDWDTPSKFDAIAKAMFEAADNLGFCIRWGADWDQDGNPRERGEYDSPHFELSR